MNPLSQSARRVELEYSESGYFGANGDLVPNLGGILEDITTNTAFQPLNSLSNSGPPRRWWPSFGGLRRPRIDRVHPATTDSFEAAVELVGGLPIGLNLVPPRQRDPLPEDVEVHEPSPWLLTRRTSEDGRERGTLDDESPSRRLKRIGARRHNVDIDGDAVRQVTGWYRRARCGDAEAMCMVGIMHLEGRGLGDCDLKASTAWFELARAQGFTQASTLLKASNISVKVLVSV